MLRSLRSTLKPVVRDALGLAIQRAGMTAPRFDVLTIVTFHRVLPSALLDQYPLRGLAVTPEDFRWFMQWFSEWYSCGTIGELYPRFRAGERDAKPFLAVSFDDGQLDNYLYAKPELDRVGVKASFFIPVDAVEQGAPLWHDRLAYAAQAFYRRSPSFAMEQFVRLGVSETAIDPVADVVVEAKRLAPQQRVQFVETMERASERNPRPDWDGMMSWEQVRSLADEGHEIGSHSMSHQLLPQLRGEPLRYEVEESKRVLEDRVQQPMKTFCYPNGDCDEVVVSAVVKAGYTQAVTTAWGPNRTATPPHTLTRCDIQSESARSTLGHLSRSRLAWRLSPYFNVTS